MEAIDARIQNEMRVKRLVKKINNNNNNQKKQQQQKKKPDSHEIGECVKCMEGKSGEIWRVRGQRRVIQDMAAVERGRDGSGVIFINVSRGFIMIF